MTTTKPILFAKSTIIHPALFLVTALYLNIISLCFLRPHIHLGPHLELFSPVLIHFLSTHPDLVKNHFSSPYCCQPVEHTRLLCLVSTFLPPISWPLVCLTSSSPSRHFQPGPPSPLSLSHFFFHQLHCKIVCSHLQCSSLYSLSTLFPVGTIYLHSFTPSYLPGLSPFQSLFQYLRYQPYECASPLPQFRCLFTRHSPLVFTKPASSIISTSALPCNT